MFPLTDANEELTPIPGKTEVGPTTSFDEMPGGGSRIPKALARSVKRDGYREIRELVRDEEPTPETTLDTAVPLVPLWNNYYHWTAGCLTRLRQSSGVSQDR